MKREPCRQSYSVRFIGVSETESVSLRSAFEVSPKSLKPYEKKDGTYVMVFELTEDFNGKLVSDCLKLMSETIICDVFISVRTEYDSEITAIPRYVTEFISDSGAELTFSFTVA